MEKETLLQLQKIDVQYGGVKALSRVDVSLDEGEVVALLGPNGAGKSTILKALFGISPVTYGKILWRGQEIFPQPHQMVERGVAFVPQGRQLFKSLTVLENLEMGGFNLSKTILKNRLAEILEFFPEIKKKLKNQAGDLSGGQQQLVAIARGLICDPKVLLLDEPSLGLSPKVVKEVFQIIKEINIERKIAIMIVEHNLQSVLRIADQAYLLDKGQVVTKDKSERIIKSGILEKVFLGKVRR